MRAPHLQARATSACRAALARRPTTKAEGGSRPVRADARRFARRGRARSQMRARRRVPGRAASRARAATRTPRDQPARRRGAAGRSTRRRGRTPPRAARRGSRRASPGSSAAAWPRGGSCTGPATEPGRARVGGRRASSGKRSGGCRPETLRRGPARHPRESSTGRAGSQATSRLPLPRGTEQRRALYSLRGAKQLVEVRHLGRVVAPCAADRTVLVDEERASIRDATVAAELPFDAERLHRLVVPVREEREVQVERLGPRDVGPLGIAGDAEWANTRCQELTAPVTQELHLVRSGGRPVEEVEDEERRPVPEQLVETAPLVRCGPNGRLRNSVCYSQHRARTLLRKLRLGRDLCHVRDLADDLDDVAVRVEDPELPVGAVPVAQDFLEALELTVGAELACMRLDLLP